MRARLLLVTLLLVLLTAFAPRAAWAQEMAYERFDVDITLNEDATFTVRAIQSIRFDDEYDFGTLEIPMLDRAQQIRVDRVLECDDGPGCRDITPLRFNTSEEDPILFVEWDYDLSSAGEIRTFVVEYTVIGGVWVYDDSDFVVWPAIPAGRSGLTVEEADVTFYLPAAGDIHAEVLSNNGRAQVRDNVVNFVVETPLPDGDAFEVSVGFPHGLVPAPMAQWQRDYEQANLRVAVQAVDVTVAVQPDGDLNVSEALTFRVEEGMLFGAFRTIRRLFLDDITDVAVHYGGEALEYSRSDGCENCFWTTPVPPRGQWITFNPATSAVEIDDEKSGQVDVDWSISPGLAAGETALFTVDYVIDGGLRMSDTAQIANLELIPDFDAEVEAASLRLLPPPGVDGKQIRVTSATLMRGPEAQPDGALLFVNEDLPEARPRWQVEIVLPAGATSAGPPAWQRTLDEQVAFAQAQQVARARRDVGYGTGGLVAAAAAAGGAVWAWMRFGRKKARASAQGYMADPPSDLAPGIVAYLMDKNASERGVLASLFHLAAAGVLEMDLTNGIQLRRKVEGPLSKTSRLPAEATHPIALEDHQLLLWNEVVLPHVPSDKFVTLDEIATPLRDKLPAIFAEMGQDAQQYFLSPSAGSGGPGCLDLGIIAALAVGGTWWVFSLDMGGAARWMLFLGLGSLLALYIAVRAMMPSGARRSESGEKEAARWALFRNYLFHLKEFGDLAAAQEILDRRFAYAVALGAEEVVLKQTEELGGTVAPWMWMPARPRPPHPQQATQSPTHLPSTEPSPGAPIPGGPAPAAAGPEAPRPSLSGMSASMGDSVSGGSASLGRTLSAAGGAAAATVVLKSRLRDRPMTWSPETKPTTMLDDIMKASMDDAKTIRTRPPQSSSGGKPGGGGGGSTWGGGGFGGGGSSWSRGGSRSTGGFSGSSSRSSSSRSSSSGSRSSGSRSSGRSGGFGKR